METEEAIKILENLRNGYERGKEYTALTVALNLLNRLYYPFHVNERVVHEYICPFCGDALGWKQLKCKQCGQSFIWGNDNAELSHTAF